MRWIVQRVIAIVLCSAALLSCSERLTEPTGGGTVRLPPVPADAIGTCGYSTFAWEQGVTSVDCSDGTNHVQVAITVSPSLVHDGITSDPGYNVSPITLTFSRPVTLIQVSFGGNVLCNAVPGTANGVPFVFNFSCPPLPPTQPNCGVEASVGVAVPPPVQVTSLTITAPSPMQYTAYAGGYDVCMPYSTSSNLYYYIYFSVDVPCPPSGDWVLDDPAVALGLRDELAASRPNPDGSGRTERRGYLYQRVDGSYFLQPAFDQTSTMCGFTFDSLPVPPTIPGATFKGDYHTHPSKHLEPLTGCPGQRPGETMKANRKAKVGGGSAGDWDFANLRAKSMYVIDQDGNVWRLDANTLVDNRKNNLNRWRYSGSCLAHP
jgi:hypothetical protein